MACPPPPAINSGAMNFRADLMSGCYHFPVNLKHPAELRYRSRSLTGGIGGHRTHPDIGQLLGDLVDRRLVAVGERRRVRPREATEPAVDLPGQPLRPIDRADIAEPDGILQRPQRD